MSWPLESIDSVVEVNPRLTQDQRPKEDIKVSFVPMAAVSEKTLRIEAEEVRSYSTVSKGYTAFKRGDVLIAKITPCFENGKMALADNLSHEMGFGTTEFHVLRASESITANYLFQLLRSPYVRKAGAMKMKGAAGQRRVPADFFASLKIPLPPLPEQKRIAAILDVADALRAKCRESIEQLDTLLHSVFVETVTETEENRTKFKLADLCEEDAPITYGILQPGPDLDTGVAYVRPSEIKGGQIVLASIRRTSPSIAAKYHKSIIETGDILLTIVGTIGNVAIVPPELSGGNITQSSARIRISESKASRRFIEYYLRSDFAKRQFAQHKLGVAVPRLNLHHVRDLEISLPARKAQDEFSKIAAKISIQKSRLQSHLTDLDTLFAALQSRAFQGEL